MSKRQLIEAIRQLNPTAQAPFLSQFEERDLEQYLEHLREAMHKRIRFEASSGQKGDLRMVS